MNLSRRTFLQLLATYSCGAFGVYMGGCSCSSTGNTSSANAQSDSASLRPENDGFAVLPDNRATATFLAFDTVVSIQAFCEQELVDAAVERCQYFESIFSRTIDSSDIGRINKAQGTSIRVANETADLITKALRYCEESQGLFDITIGAVSSLWDFKQGIIPDEALIQEAITHIDYRKVLVDSNVVTLLDPYAKLDLGGIAKGYIADDLCTFLEQAGCTSGFLNLGGNVKTIGRRADGALWGVGIQNPNAEKGDIIARVESNGTSVVTSGLYERQFEYKGQRYWHILDPRTGWPVNTDLLSASIITKASLDGDGYTKPLFMMGHDEALNWLESHPKLEGVLVDSKGEISKTSNCTAQIFGYSSAGLTHYPVRASLADYSWEEISGIASDIAQAKNKEEALQIAAVYNLVADDGTLDGTQLKSVDILGESYPVRIIGFYHDTTEVDTKAGITFQFAECIAVHEMNALTTSTDAQMQFMATYGYTEDDLQNDWESGVQTNLGGWEASAMRAWLNTEVAQTLTDELSSVILPVNKFTNNEGWAQSAIEPTTTLDTLWLPSLCELCGETFWHTEDLYNNILNTEGAQYQLFNNTGLNDLAGNKILERPFEGQPCLWWERSPNPSISGRFQSVLSDGFLHSCGDGANYAHGVAPCFCV